MMDRKRLISKEELNEIFAGDVPWLEINQILWDGSDDRTIGDVRAEVRALAESRKKAA